MTTTLPVTRIGQLEIRQRTAGGTFYLLDPASREEWWPDRGTVWTRADAKREADRLLRAGDGNRLETCQRCHRRISGGILRCTCAPINLDSDAAVCAVVAANLDAALKRIADTAATARLDRLEREALSRARTEIRTALAAFAPLAKRLVPAIDEAAPVADAAD